MEASVSTTSLRIIIALIGIAVLLAIYLYGRPRKRAAGRRAPPKRTGGARVEPVLGSGVDAGASDVAMAATSAHDATEDAVAEHFSAKAPDSWAETDAADAAQVERILTLYVVARDGELLHGSDIVVAAEKVGLQFGERRIFHRRLAARAGMPQVFSMANMVKPGYFDVEAVAELTTPGVTFFATLPGPLPALDTWEAMLPAAERVAQLVDGVLLDDTRNALARQRVASIREELRDWDRQHAEAHAVTKPPWR